MCDPHIMHIERATIDDEWRVTFTGRRDSDYPDVLGHHTVVIGDFADEHARLQFLAIASVFAAHALHPDHRHTDTHPREPMT